MYYNPTYIHMLAKFIQTSKLKYIYFTCYLTFHEDNKITRFVYLQVTNQGDCLDY